MGLIKGRVFIVDSENSVALNIQKDLLDLDCDVVGIANSGREAVDLIDEACPNLILYHVKKESLNECIQAAHEIKNKYLVPLVFLTAKDQGTLEQLKVCEPTGYLFSPFERTHLEATLEEALTNYCNPDQFGATASDLTEICEHLQNFVNQKIQKTHQNTLVRSEDQETSPPLDGDEERLLALIKAFLAKVNQ